MVDEITKAAAGSIARDIQRHLSQVALAALAESLRKEEPSGALGTATLHLLDALEAQPEVDHGAQCAEHGYRLVA
jgi:hypothetical protein